MEELFTITCDSCTARLKVRQESAVGQILACPKCGSMVKVEPPEGWVPPPSASQQLSESDFQSFRDSQKKTDANSNHPSSGQAVKTKSPRSASAVASGQIAAAKKPAGEQPILPNAQWTAASAQQRQKVVILICASAAVLILVLAFIGFLVVQTPKNTQNDTSDLAKQTNANSDPSLDTDDIKDPSFDKSSKEKNDQNSKGETTDAKNPSDNTNDIEKKNDSQKSDAEANKSDIDQTKQNEKSTTPILVGIDNPADDRNKTDPATTSEDPLANLDLNKTESNEPFKGFSDLTKTTPMEIAGTIDSEDIESEIGIGSYIIDRPKPIKVNLARLDDRIGLDIKSKSLPQLINVLSDFSTIPIALDIDSILALDVDYLKQADYTFDDNSIAEILNQVLTPLNLAFESHPWGVLVTDANRKEIVAREYEIFEFEKNKEEAYKTIATLIESRFAPESWVTNGGDAELIRTDRKFTIKQTRNNHLAIGQFFEKANAGNALAKGDTNIDSALFTTRSAAIKGTLATACDLDILVPAPILQVVKKVEKKTGLVILMDWPTLIEKNWNPETVIPWESRGEPVGKMLDNIASSMNLAYRIIDSKTVELTSKEKVATTLSLEFYPCHEILQKKKLPELLEFVGTAMHQKVNPKAGMFLDYDKELQCLVAILPQPLHQRLDRVLDFVK